MEFGIKKLKSIAISLLLSLGVLCFFCSTGRAESESSNSSGDKVLGVETTRSVDAQGNVTEKRLTKKIRSRTVVDFEEASIEGKIKKPSAAYLLHGADLDFKHLYRIKQNQRAKTINSYGFIE